MTSVGRLTLAAFILGGILTKVRTDDGGIKVDRKTKKKNARKDKRQKGTGYHRNNAQIWGIKEKQSSN